MRERTVLDFRTPQHPSAGTNNWGGASPLLARNIPKESLEQRYSRLNNIRTRDEIFPTNHADFNRYDHPPTPGRSRKGILLKLLFPKEENVTLGGNAKKKWLRWFSRLSRWDPKNRWPNDDDLARSYCDGCWYPLLMQAGT